MVLQRVLSASVSVDGSTTGKIGPGYLLFVGLGAGDDEATVRRLATDISKARLMSDAQGKMGVSLRDSNGQALAVSQFTLLADFTKGNRPSFNAAAKPEVAKPLFDLFVQELSNLLGQPVPTGVFGADMRIELVNDGPVTIILE